MGIMNLSLNKKGALIIGCLFILAIAASYKTLTHEVTYTKGINGHVKEYKIPLYLKIHSFLDRHFHFQYLAKTITRGLTSDDEKIVAIFKWVHENINPQPNELPVIDDHPLHIIIRGYGADDQLEDVFTLLCNYAGIPAYMAVLESGTSDNRITLSFVFFKEKWRVFHVARNLMFYVNNEWASFEELLNQPQQIENTKEFINSKNKVQYKEFFLGFKGFNRQYKNRYLLQTPFGRFKSKIE